MLCSETLFIDLGWIGVQGKGAHGALGEWPVCLLRVGTCDLVASRKSII
mgnify:CR=1 FL=1